MQIKGEIYVANLDHALVDNDREQLFDKLCNGGEVMFEARCRSTQVGEIIFISEAEVGS